MADLQKGFTFADGDTVHGADLNALVDSAAILAAFISGKTLKDPCAVGDEVVINDGGVLKKTTLNAISALVVGGAAGLVHGKTAVTALTDLDEFLLWEDTAAGDRKITRASIRDGYLLHKPGMVIQSAYDDVVGVETTSSTMSHSSTPDIDEGEELLAIDFTPRFANSQILARFSAFGGAPSSGYVVVALFRDDNFLNGTVSFESTGALCFEYRDAPGDTAAHEYRVRFGRSGASQATINGSGLGAELLGGNARATLVLQEILV